MADSLVFTTAVRRKQPFPFTLDGREYAFTPPKLAGAVLPMLSGEVSDLKATMDWLGDGLSDEDEEFILKRLQDPDDDLDLPMLMEVARKLMARVTGRPTTSPSGSQPPSSLGGVSTTAKLSDKV